jgi:AcrR family transcriptional regulator
MRRRLRGARARPRRIDRQRVLEAASDILVRDGAGSLSMRRIADRLGVSTMPLYTLFAGKDGLLQALVADGYRRLSVALGSVPAGNPWSRLRDLGHEYRRFCAENPVNFTLMGSASGAAADPDVAPHVAAAHRCLTEAVAAVLAELDRPARDIEPATYHVWFALHGFCGLERAGRLGRPEAAEAAFASTLEWIERSLRASSDAHGV